MVSNYHISTAKYSLLHDYEELSDHIPIDALVASGDCFVTLATQLDAMTHNADATIDDNREVLEQMIRTLLYLQRHYGITKQTPNYRQ